MAIICVRPQGSNMDGTRNMSQPAGQRDHLPQSRQWLPGPAPMSEAGVKGTDMVLQSFLSCTANSCMAILMQRNPVRLRLSGCQQSSKLLVCSHSNLELSSRCHAEELQPANAGTAGSIRAETHTQPAAASAASDRLACIDEVAQGLVIGKPEARPVRVLPPQLASKRVELALQVCDSE